MIEYNKETTTKDTLTSFLDTEKGHPENPYMHGTVEFKAWEEGYKARHFTPCGYQPDMSKAPDHMLYGSRV